MVNVSAGGRIEALDVLRGFALFGVLLMNLPVHGHPLFGDASYLRETFPGSADRAAEWVVTTLADGKFILIFSFLFGYGLSVQMARAEARGVPPLPRYWRRLVGLLVLGLLHAFLLFVGDILVAYAVLGAALIPFRKLSPRWLLRAALACWAVSLLVYLGLGFVASLSTQGQFGSLEKPELGPTVELYRNGPLLGILKDRAVNVLIMYAIFPFNLAPQVLGMFLVGLAAAKRGLLTDLAAEAPFWRRVFAVALPVALVGDMAYASLNVNDPDRTIGVTALQDFVTPWETALGMVGRALFDPFGTAAYVSGFALLLRSPSARRLCTPFAVNGRMSLSNYLGQSLICNFVFLSFGLRLFGRLGESDMVWLALAIYSGQTLASYCWFRAFGIGPMEWLLRAWVGQRSPMPVTVHPTRRNLPISELPIARPPADVGVSPSPASGPERSYSSPPAPPASTP